jgi:hypothetical protein
MIYYASRITAYMTKQTGKFQQQLNWYLSLVVLFLFVTVPPLLCGLFYLSQVPEVMWEREEKLVYDRLWMYRERRPLGLAYQTQRVIETYSPSEVCVENRLRFFLWGRTEQAEESTSSHKMVLVDNQWQSTGEACN